MKNCNWPEADTSANPIRYRRDASNEFDLDFSLNFDDLYIDYLLQHNPATLKAVSIEGSGNNSDTEEDRMLARLSSRQSKKVEAQLAKAEQLCRSTMSRYGHDTGHTK